jgi:L-seryl-tRNA(Ser) seleniumtransferase
MNPEDQTWQTRVVTNENPYRSLPSVDELAAEIEGRLPWPLLVASARLALEEAREEISAGRSADPVAGARNLARTLERRVGIPVINATGVLLHTNLGRAPWSDQAADRAGVTARHYTNLELSLDTGERSRRGTYVADLLVALTGAEDALVVNNNAAAVLLALAATSSGKAVPVARGELIEIGGSYRLPAVIEASGARLVEVGTTNRTRLGDYRTTLQVHHCGSILKVHPSNYRIEGFTAQPDLSDLAQLAHAGGVPLIYDIGSGLLDAAAPWLPGRSPSWLADEPAARQALEAGAEDVVTDADGIIEVSPAPEDCHRGAEQMAHAGLKPETAEVTQRASTYVALSGEDAEKMLNLLEALEDLDDVQNVYTNAELDTVLQRRTG